LRRIGVFSTGAALGLVLIAGPAAAQERVADKLTVEPYVGLFHDAYDIGANGSTGTLAGVRVAYALGARTRLVGNVGGGRTTDVAMNAPGMQDYWVYGNRWLMTTAGAEYDVVAGPTALALGLQAGAGWRKVLTEDQVGTPTEPGRYMGSGYAFYDVVVPSLTLRREITPRASITLGVSDYVFDVLEWSPDHSPALSLGVSLR
jgi:hypothetical protein